MIDIGAVVRIVRAEGYRRVALQLPEGLKTRAPEIADELEASAGCKVFIIGDPCYGACGLADTEALALSCNALFHFGHTRLLGKPALPVHYIQVLAERDPIPLLQDKLGELPGSVGLVTTAQHLHHLPRIKRFLEEKGVKVVLGKAGGRVERDAQVLGCSFAAARRAARDVEALLYIGTGDFHPLGIALSTGRRTLALDLERGELRSMSELAERMLRKRFALIAKAESATRFGVIIGLRQGQRRIGLALKAKRLIEARGRKAWLLALREITPESLLPYLSLQVFVNTACPRVSIDDAERYRKPLLTPIELEIALGERRWEDYEMDEIT